VLQVQDIAGGGVDLTRDDNLEDVVVTVEIGAPPE
jgi:hypothetical protein